MQMEDHHLRQLLNGKPISFQPINPHDTTTDLLFSPAGHRNLQPPQQPHHHHHQQQHHHHHQPFDMTQMVGIHSVHHEFPSDSTDPMAAIGTVTSASTLSPSCGFDGEGAAYGGDGGTGRWPRQETLTLLEIRSRLDPKFKEANQKGPLWDEVSRIMFEEHGYQRSGKKCREKFENLYKYYKKTKEGKAGRQDGKHYRFFRQLEALYGDNNTSNNNGVSGQEISPLVVGNNNFQFHGTQNSKLCESLSLSNSSKFETSSSDGTDLKTKRRGRRGWKSTIKEFIDSQIGKLMERQEAWLVKLTKTLEEKEEERVLREERWRQEEASRIDREHKFWAKERAWIEARDAALMEALHNLSGKQRLKATSSDSENHENHSVKTDGWAECEVSKLIQLRTSMETRFQQESEVLLWEEISGKMSCLGFEKSGFMCKEKWDSISAYTLTKTRKRKENLRGFDYPPQHNEPIFNQGNDGSSHAVGDSCFRFFMADGENLWENYGLKLSN